MRIFIIFGSQWLVLEFYQNYDDLFTLGTCRMFLFSRYIYWITDASITRSLQDGTNQTTLVDSGIMKPTCLYVDLDTNEIYWCDVGTDNIQVLYYMNKAFNYSIYKQAENLVIFMTAISDAFILLFCHHVFLSKYVRYCSMLIFN